MDTFETLKIFFNMSFENEINNKMLYYSYHFEYNNVREYVNNLLSIPLSEYVGYLCDNYNVSYLEAKDILQFSNFEDFSTKICKVIKENGDKGFSVLDIGKFLENDGIVRKDGAYLKYGENHAKAAREIGLLFSLSNKYFLSCVGYIFNDLEEKIRNRLLIRLFLRNKLIRRIIYRWKSDGSVDYYNEVGFLSLTTQKRRKPNIKAIIEFLSKSSEYNFVELLNNIKF